MLHIELTAFIQPDSDWPQMETLQALTIFSNHGIWLNTVLPLILNNSLPQEKIVFLSCLVLSSKPLHIQPVNLLGNVFMMLQCLFYICVQFILLHFNRHPIILEDIGCIGLAMICAVRKEWISCRNKANLYRYLFGREEMNVYSKLIL